MAVPEGRSAEGSATPQAGALEPHGTDLSSTIVELAPDGILVVDAAGRVSFANSKAGEIFAYGVSELVGTVVEELIPERFRAGHGVHRSEFAAQPSSRPMGVGLDLWAVRRDGSEIPVQVSLSPITTEGSTATIVVVREVTQQRASEALERAHLLAEDADRIASELHERVIEKLFLAGISIQSVLRLTNDPIQGRLSEAVDQVDSAIREIRDVVFNKFRSSGPSARPS